MLINFDNQDIAGNCSCITKLVLATLDGAKSLTHSPYNISSMYVCAF